MCSSYLACYNIICFFCFMKHWITPAIQLAVYIAIGLHVMFVFYVTLCVCMCHPLFCCVVITKLIFCQASFLHSLQSHYVKKIYLLEYKVVSMMRRHTVHTIIFTKVGAAKLYILIQGNLVSW